MTVRDIIKILSLYDRDEEVFTRDMDGDLREIQVFFIEGGELVVEC